MPYPPGGGTDVSARVVARKLNESLGQSVVIENRPGASGNTAAGLVARSAPDGHTLLFASSAIAFPILFTNLPFDVNKDLAFISLVAMGPSVLVAHPSLPVKDVKQLVALARTRPKQVLYASDAFPGRVFKLSLDGKVLGVLGESGKQLKQFGWVHEIACPSENTLYVGELLSWRVSKLTLKPTAAQQAANNR